MFSAYPHRRGVSQTTQCGAYMCAQPQGAHVGGLLHVRRVIQVVSLSRAQVPHPPRAEPHAVESRRGVWACSTRVSNSGPSSRLVPFPLHTLTE